MKIVIGRFQPVHTGHIYLIKQALIQCEKDELLLILLGSSFQAPTPKNPWNWKEREMMITDALIESGINTKNIRFAPIRDFLYSDPDWYNEVANVVNSWKEWNIDRANPKEVTLVGYIKDSSSWYLKMFPQWKLHEIKPINILNATDIRKYLFEGFYNLLNGITPKTKEYLFEWLQSEEGKLIREEYNFYQQYKKEAATYKWPITYVTVDSVIHYKGHILLIERKQSPGKGLYALPGGFINSNEFLIDSAIRETLEETKFLLRKEWHCGSFIADHPQRSLRGRTISHCFAFNVPEIIELRNYPPIVEGGDDARKAFWCHINEIRNDLESRMFEDHLSIINKLYSRFK